MVSVERTSRAVAWTGLEIASLLLLGIVSLIILARLLGPADFGLATLALVAVQFLTVLTRAIFIDAIVERQRLEPGHLDAAFWAGLATAALLTGLCLLAAPWVGLLFDEPRLPGVFAWTALSLLFTGVDGVPVAILRRQLKMKELALRSFVARLAAAVVGIGMALAGYGVWSLVGQQIALEVGYAAVSLWLAGWRPARVWVSRRHLRELAGFAMPWLGGELLMTGNLRLFSVLVGYLFGTTALGYLNVGFRTVGTIGAVLEVAAHQLSMPIFARIQADLPALRLAFCKSTALASFMLLPFFTGMIVCAEPVILALLGPDWLPAVPLVQLMSAATFVQIVLSLSSSVYSAIGRPIWRLWRGALDLAVSTLGLVALAGLGPIAAGIVWLGRFAFLAPFSYFGMWRLVRLTTLRQLRVLLPSTVAAGVMAAVLLATRRALPLDWGAGQDLALLVPLGGLVYLLAFAAVARGEIREYLDYARAVLTPAEQRSRPT